MTVEVFSPPAITVEVVESEGVQVVEIIQRGPPGADAPEYATLIDSANPSTIYVGKAPDGAVEADATWTVRRSTFDAAGVLTTTAVAVDVTWTGRAGHNYT